MSIKSTSRVTRTWASPPGRGPDAVETKEEKVTKIDKQAEVRRLEATRVPGFHEDLLDRLVAGVPGLHESTLDWALAQEALVEIAELSQARGEA